MSNGDKQLKTDDPVFRQGLRERLRMRSLQLARTRSERKLPTFETEPEESGHDFKAEAELRKQFDNYKRIGLQPALPHDEGGRLQKQCDKVERLLTIGEIEEMKLELDKLEDMTEAVLKLVAQRQLQKNRLPANPMSLDFGERIGAGQFGEIFHAVSDTGKPLAVKTGTGKEGQEDLKKEIDIYAQLGESENIMKCYGMHNINGEDCMVMETIEGGDIGDAFKDLNNLRNGGKLSHEEYWGSLQHLMRGMFRGLAQMEKAGFVHHDLKTNNVMFDSRTGEAKLVDMGRATPVGGQVQQQNPYWSAPEKVHQEMDLMAGSDTKQDIFSLGQMLFGEGEREAKTREDGTTSFGDSKTFTYGANNIFQPFQLYFPMTQFVTPNEEGEYDKRVLTPEKPGKEAGKRGKFAEGYESDYVSFLNAIMHPDPTQRLSASQALEHPFLKDSLLDEEGAKTALSKMVESRNPPVVDPLEAERHAADVRRQVKEVLGEAKAWRKKAEAAQKLDEKALKQIEAASLSLITTKEGKQAISKRKLGKLTDRLRELNEMDESLTAGADRVSSVASALGDLIPASKNEETEDKRQLALDQRSLESLGQLARLLTVTHGQVVQTIGAMQQLLETVEEQENKGRGEKVKPEESPKEIRRDAQTVRDRLEDYWETLDKDAEAYQQFHAKLEGLISKADRAISASKSGGDLPADKLCDDLRLEREAAAQAKLKLNEWEATLGMIARFQELAGATTKKEKGRKKEKAVALATDDRNLLIALSALQRRIEWLTNGYQSDSEAANAKVGDLIAELDRRIFDVARAVNTMKLDESTYRQVDQMLFELDQMRKSPNASKRAKREALNCSGRVRLALKAKVEEAIKDIEEPGEKAKVLLEFGAARPPSSKGNSDSFFVYGPDGRPAYIMKPTNGESRFSDAWPEGGGAPREILMSRMNGFLEEAIGIDFGIPKTELVTLEDPSFSSGTKSQDTKRVGALQEALTIHSGDPPDVKKMFETDPLPSNEQITELINSIHPKDVENIAIFDFLMLNSDRHAENLMLQNPGTAPGSTRLAPIDSGQCLPTPEAFRRGSASMSSGGVYDPEVGIIATEGDNFLMQLPASQQKMSSEAQHALQNIDPDALAEKMKQEYEEMVKDSPEMDGKVDESSIEMVRRSAAFLKKACSELTMRQISQVYACGFMAIVDAKKEDMDREIDTAIENIKEYIELGGDEEMMSKGVLVNNPPLNLSERLDILKKIKQTGATPVIVHYRTLCAQLADIDKYIADSSDEDKRRALELYNLRDTLDNMDHKLANDVEGFCAYKMVGGDPMLKNLLAGNDKAFKEYAKSKSVKNKGMPMWLNPFKEFFRLGGYARLKDLLGEGYADIEDKSAEEHEKLLYKLSKKSPEKPVSTTGDVPPTTTTTELEEDQVQEKVEDLVDEAEDEEERLVIGKVSSANPSLWFDDKRFGERYRVSTSKPRIAGDWHSLNQFCSLLSIRWLKNPGASLRFADLPERQQLIDADRLILFAGLDDQVRLAMNKIGGQRKSSLAKEDLENLEVGTRIWFGNDRHVMAAVILPDDRARFYDPDTGKAKDMSKDDLLKQLRRGNVFVVAGKAVEVELEDLPEGGEDEVDLQKLLDAKGKPDEFLSELLLVSENTPTLISKGQFESIRDAYKACMSAIAEEDEETLKQEIFTLNDAIREVPTLAGQISDVLLEPVQKALEEMK